MRLIFVVLHQQRKFCSVEFFPNCGIRKVAYTVAIIVTVHDNPQHAFVHGLQEQEPYFCRIVTVLFQNYIIILSNV